MKLFRPSPEQTLASICCCVGVSVRRVSVPTGARRIMTRSMPRRMRRRRLPACPCVGSTGTSSRPFAVMICGRMRAHITMRRRRTKLLLYLFIIGAADRTKGDQPKNEEAAGLKIHTVHGRHLVRNKPRSMSRIFPSISGLSRHRDDVSCSTEKLLSKPGDAGGSRIKLLGRSGTKERRHEQPLDISLKESNLTLICDLLAWGSTPKVL